MVEIVIGCLLCTTGNRVIQASEGLILLPKAGVTQARAGAQWAAYLSQSSRLSPSLLKEFQMILGPVTYHSNATEENGHSTREESGSGMKILNI